MAKIDVAVPCYNYGRFLEACVRSVLEQSVTDLRVLIIDDASTDDTLSVATALAQEDGRVSVIAHAQNQGHIRTYNEGIAWATADYFLLLSADDLLLPGALERATRILDEHLDIVLAHGDCPIWRDTLPSPDCTQNYTWERQDLIKESCVSGDTVVYTATAVVRTETQKRIGGYLETLPHCADLEMWLRFALNGGVARIGAPQALYRIHSSAMSRTNKVTTFGSRQRQAAFAVFFDRYEQAARESSQVALSGRAKFLRAQAHKAVAQLTFRAGIDHLRRGRVAAGLEFFHLAMDQYPPLRFCPPFWLLFRIPGPEGRRWAASRLLSFFMRN